MINLILSVALASTVCVIQPPMNSKVCQLEEIYSNGKICSWKKHDMPFQYIKWEIGTENKWRCNFCVKCGE